VSNFARLIILQCEIGEGGIISGTHRKVLVSRAELGIHVRVLKMVLGIES